MYSTPVTSCNCRDDCKTTVRCPCRAKTSEIYKMVANSRRTHLAYVDGGILNANRAGCIFECNASCRCNARCTNRVTQRGIKCELYLRRNEKSGYGIFTNKIIERGTFISRYEGLVLTTPQANTRANKSFYFYTLNYVGHLKSAYEVKQYTIPDGAWASSGDDHKDKNNIYRWLKNLNGELPSEFICDANTQGNVGRFYNVVLLNFVKHWTRKITHWSRSFPAFM